MSCVSGWQGHFVIMYARVLLYLGPNITIAGVEGAKRIGNQFYFQPNQQQGKIYILVVSTLEEEYFKVNRTNQTLETGEILFEKLFRNPLNYTSVYALTLPKLTPLINKTYIIEVGMTTPMFSQFMTSSISIHIIKLTGCI